MPELPEVEVVARQLEKKLKGKYVKRIEVRREKSFMGDPEELRGKKIGEVERVAKMIKIGFLKWEKVVVVHLKMTGQLVWRPKNWSKRRMKSEVVGGHPTADWVSELPSAHTRVIWEFKDGSRLFFNDQRVFGWMKIMSENEWKKLVSKLPPDVVDKDFTVKYLTQAVSRSGRAVKLLIMDQQKMGGMGNIYANDALNLAKIKPIRPAKELDEKEVKALYKAMKEVIRRGIAYGGATYATFRNMEGIGGKYQEHFLTYNRAGKKCVNCGGEIKKISIGGRGTYYCEKCQK